MKSGKHSEEQKKEIRKENDRVRKRNRVHFVAILSRIPSKCIC